MALQLEGEQARTCVCPTCGTRHAASHQSGNLPICASIAPPDTDGSMPSLPRGPWRGESERMPGGFRLTRERHGRVHTAMCEVWSHREGAELRLTFDDGPMPVGTVVSSDAEIRELLAEWTSVLATRGWS